MTSAKTCIPLQDPFSGKLKEVVADTHVRWTSGEAWKGVIAEGYSFDRLETPEFQTVNHNIVLHLSSPAMIDLDVDGRQDQRMRVPGDLTFLPAGTVYRVRSKTPHEVLVVSVSQQMMNTSGFEPRDTLGLFSHEYLVDAQIEHICKALMAEVASNFASGSLYGESLGLAFASRLLRCYSNRNAPPNKLGGLAPQTLRRVIDFIDSDLAGSLHMCALAEVAGLSQHRFAHNFKMQTGVPPHRYVTAARIERAKRLLRETEISIVEVALAVGLQSSSRLNHLFKKELGTTPGSYRTVFR